MVIELNVFFYESPFAVYESSIVASLAPWRTVAVVESWPATATAAAARQVAQP